MWELEAVGLEEERIDGSSRGVREVKIIIESSEVGD